MTYDTIFYLDGLPFDIQNIIRSSGGVIEYYLSVISKLFKPFISVLTNRTTGQPKNDASLPSLTYVGLRRHNKSMPIMIYRTDRETNFKTLVQNVLQAGETQNDRHLGADSRKYCI